MENNGPKPKSIAPLLLVILALVCCAVAANYRAALEGFVARGTPGPQYLLGECYYRGLGVSRSYAKAVKWFRLAAQQDDAKAQTALGLMYLNGLGGARDYQIAFDLFSKAAQQGVPEAENQLGKMYAQGKGVLQDLEKAALWFSEASSHGDKTAEQNLKLIASTRPGFIASLTLRTGKTYHSVRVQRVELNALTITFQPHSGALGMARVAFRDLPDELQNKYSFSGGSPAQLANSSRLTSVEVQTL